jgi:ABC-type spermidine/putrescine transport system permease subunit II
VRRLVLVSVPAVLPDLAVAALLGMMVSWGQYGLSLAVGGGLPTLPGVLVPFVGTDPQVAAALALILLAPAVAAVVIALRLARAPA